MKKLVSLGVLTLAVFLVASPVFAQEAVMSQEQFVNHVMRDAVIPMNDPDPPDVIPAGYEVQMPGDTTYTVEAGESIWEVTERFVEENNLYEGWRDAGMPPVQPFVHASLAERPDLERRVAELQGERDTLAATVDSLAAELSNQQEGGSGSNWTLLVIIFLLAIAALTWSVYLITGRSSDT